jgi:hypothetical protein
MSTNGRIKQCKPDDDPSMRQRHIGQKIAGNRKHGRAKMCGSRSDRAVLPDYKKKRIKRRATYHEVFKDEKILEDRKHKSQPTTAGY